MRKKQTRIFLFTGIFILAVVVISLGVKYFPFSKVIRKTSFPESEKVNRRPIVTNAPNAIYNGFETELPSADQSRLYKGNAHSGQFSTKAFGKNSFSIAIERTAGQIGLENLKAVAISSWIYVFPDTNRVKRLPDTNKVRILTDTNRVNGWLVFSVANTQGGNTCWKGVSVDGYDIQKGAWFKISGFFDLSDTKFQPGDRIQVYFWNNSYTDILADDYYIVFGGTRERKGDSAMVDMTRDQPFRQKFNFPPYPVRYFDLVDIHNRNSDYLVQKEDQKEGSIFARDLVITGRFLNNPGGTDDILLIKPGGDPEIFTWCKNTGEYRKINVSIPADILSYFPVKQALKGLFTGTGTEQVLLIGSGKSFIGSFDEIRDPCNRGTTLKSVFRVLWSSGSAVFPGINVTSGTLFRSADLDGDGNSELLVISDNGTWTIFKYPANRERNWSVYASGEKDAIGEWNPEKMQRSVTTGRFLRKFPQDVVLTVFRPMDECVCNYTLRRFDPGRRMFLPVFPEKQNFLGKTIGLDTLKPDDEFFTGNFGSSVEPGSGRYHYDWKYERKEIRFIDNTFRVVSMKPGEEFITGKAECTRDPVILRYNRDWRFDLKEIMFNDTTFRVIGPVDFSGYENDHNPKYFESLRIFAGNIVDPEISSVLLVARNSKDVPYLPNTIQVYSPGKK